MRLYISSDMEGVAGVCAWEQVDARTPHPEYAIYRRYYTQEVAAAIEGARAGGRRRGARQRLARADAQPAVRRASERHSRDLRQPQTVFDGAGRRTRASTARFSSDITAAPATRTRCSATRTRRRSSTKCASTACAAAKPRSMRAARLLTACRCCSLPATARPSRACRRRCRGCAASIVKESIGNFAADSIVPAAARRADPAGGRSGRRRRERRAAVRLRTAGRARGRSREDGTGRSRRDHSGLRTHRRAQRSLHPRRLSNRVQSLRRDVAPRRQA